MPPEASGSKGGYKKEDFVFAIGAALMAKEMAMMEEERRGEDKGGPARKEATEPATKRLKK